jgi:hypothetical protein
MPGSSKSVSTSDPNPKPTSSIHTECTKGYLIIEGVRDCGILNRVLDRLLR